MGNRVGADGGHHVIAGTATPMFSVLIPAYKAQDFIGEAVASLIAQGWRDWETIIVVDGLGDPSAEAARAAIRGDERFTVIEQEHLGGLQAVLRAFAESTAPYICRLDSDDWWEPDYLSHQARMIRDHPGYDVYAHNGWSVYPDGRKEPWLSVERYQTEHEITFVELIERNVVFAMSTMTREAYVRTGGPPDPFAGDYGLWLNVMATGGRIYYSPARIAWYRRHPGAMSNDLVALEESVVRVLESLGKRDDLSPDASDALRGSLARRRARVVRRRLEVDLAKGRARDVRRRYWQARRGYDRFWAWLVVLPIVLVAPAMVPRLRCPSRLDEMLSDGLEP